MAGPPRADAEVKEEEDQGQGNQAQTGLFTPDKRRRGPFTTSFTVPLLRIRRNE
jgi:hypothetical protein